MNESDWRPNDTLAPMLGGAVIYLGAVGIMDMLLALASFGLGLGLAPVMIHAIGLAINSLFWIGDVMRAGWNTAEEARVSLGLLTCAIVMNASFVTYLLVT